MSDAADYAAAFAEVVRKLHPDGTPVMTRGDGVTPDAGMDVDAALIENRRATTWAEETAYTYGQIVMPTVRNGHRYRVTQAGTSGDTEPTWPTSDYGAVTNGSSSPVLTFEEAGSEYANVYDVRATMYALWVQRAAKASGSNTFLRDGRAEGSDYTYLNCRREAERYRPVGVA